MSETRAANDATTGTCEPVAMAAGVVHLVRAWSTLLESELLLARRSVGCLLLGALALPVIGLGVWFALNALLVALMQIYSHSLVLALLAVCGLQLAALALLLHRLRRWMRDLTLPQSRAALTRAMEKMS